MDFARAALLRGIRFGVALTAYPAGGAPAVQASLEGSAPRTEFH